MPTAPDPLAGDVAAEPAAPRTGWRRFAPWLAALLAVVVVVGWQVLARSPQLEITGASWSLPTGTTCAGTPPVLGVSAADADGHVVHAELLRNASQFPVTLTTGSSDPFRTAFGPVVDPATEDGHEPAATSTSSATVPTGRAVWVYVLPPANGDDLDGSSAPTTDAVTVHVSTLGISTSQDVPLKTRVALVAADGSIDCS